MRLSAVGKVMSKLFTDKLDIERYTSETSDSIITTPVLSSSPEFVGVPCKISFGKLDSTNKDKTESTPITVEMKIICGLGVDIKAGDKVTAYKIGVDRESIIATYEGKIADPAVFITHKEVLFLKEGDA